MRAARGWRDEESRSVFAVHGSRFLTAEDRDVVAHADAYIAGCMRLYAPHAFLDLRDGTGRTHWSRRHCRQPAAARGVQHRSCCCCCCCCWIYRQSRVYTCAATRPPTAPVFSLARSLSADCRAELVGCGVEISRCSGLSAKIRTYITTRLPPHTYIAGHARWSASTISVLFPGRVRSRQACLPLRDGQCRSRSRYPL